MKKFYVAWIEKHTADVEAENEDEAYTMALCEDHEVTLYNKSLIEIKEEAHA